VTSAGHLLGVDIGTSSSKGVIAAADGTVLATAVQPHSVSRPRPGWVEHDPEQVWWGEFVSLARQLRERVPGPIAAVGVSGIGPCLLPATADGQPLRPAILYGVDTRASAEIAELTERYGSEAIVARGGSRLTSQAVGPKLLWLRRNEPQVWRQTELANLVGKVLVEWIVGSLVIATICLVATFGLVLGLGLVWDRTGGRSKAKPANDHAAEPLQP